MDPATIITLVTLLLKAADEAVKVCKQINGEDSIPTLEEILKQNAELQAKIDAARKV
jgi:hypothetical protein